MSRLAVACLLWGALAQAAELRIKLSSPGELVGDGRTVTLTLTVSPPEELADLSLDSDAGQVGATRAVRPGVYEIDFTPPRVAVAQRVSVSATVAGGVVSAPAVMRVLPAPLTATELATGGPLDLRAPSRVLLGSDAPVTLTLKRTARAPSLSANVGKLGAVEPRGDRWLVRWTPPRERFPQVALIGAASDGAVDWVAMQLHGIGSIETRTKPGARLTVRVGDTDFGPFRADATGLVTTSVIAPPGTASARGHAVDKLGNEKDAPIDLGTPPFSRVLALCAPQAADLFVVDATGAPADAKALTADAGGTPLALARIGPGHARGPLFGSGAPVEVRVFLDGKMEGRCTTTPNSVAPIGLRVSLDKGRWRAGDPPVEVTAELTYPDAGAHAPWQIALTPDGGAIVDVVPTPGGVHARWRPPERFGGRARAKLVARLDEAALRGEVELALEPGPAARLAVEAPGAVIADGRAIARLRVHAEDAFGNPTRTSAPRATDGRAELRGVDEAGVATLDWRPPERARSGDAEVDVRDEGGAQGSVRVKLRAARRAFGVGIDVGYLTNFARISAALVTVDFAWRLPWLRRNLSIGATAGFYAASYTVAGAEPIDVSVTAIPLLARLDYQIPLGPAAIFAGVGGGVLLPVISAHSASAVLSSTEAAGAFAARVGADLDVRLGRVVVEVGYWYAPVTDGALSGNFGGLSVLAGWRLEL